MFVSPPPPPPPPPLLPPRAKVEVKKIVAATRVNNNMLRVYSSQLEDYRKHMKDATQKTSCKLKRAHGVVIAT